MSDKTNISSITVQTVSSDGKAPKRRISTPAAAQAAYYQARQMERQRDARYGDIRGIYDGYPPIPPSRMEEMGMGDMPNFNTKQFQSKIDMYVDTWRRVTCAGNIWYEVKAKHADPREAQRRSIYLTSCFNRAIARWDSTDFRRGNAYVLRCAARDTQLGLYGIGISHFNDSIDFRWSVRPTRKVMVPYGTKITMENCPVVFIEDETISVRQLYSMRDKPGWNKEAVLYSLYLRTNQTRSAINGQAWTYAQWENDIRNNDTWLWTTEFDPLKVIHCYVAEFGDNANEQDITHTIFIDTQATGGGTLNNASSKPEDADEKKTGWLYEKTKAAKRWSEVLAVFADNAGPEGDWHGVKGYGDLIYDQCHFNNQVLNRAAAAAIIQNMPIFIGADEMQRQRLNQITFSFGAITFPDLGQMSQLKINGDIPAISNLFMLGTQSLDTISRTNPLNQAMGPEKTATQETYERMAQTELSGLQIANYQATGNDALGAEMYRRIAQPASKYPEAHPGGNVAKMFRDEAKEFGIPEKELLDVESVMATRQGGSGSMGVDIMKWKEAMAVATPGPGQLFCRKSLALTLFPPDVADQIVEEKAPPPDEQDVQIANENLDIQAGQTPMAFGFQPHEKHLRQPSGNDHLTILSGLEQVVNAMIKQGIPPNQIQDAVKLHNSFDAGIAHCEQHVAFMQEMPRSGSRPSIYEGFIKEINPVLNNLRQISRSFGETIAQAQEAAAQLPANQDPKMLETQAKIERDNALAAADIERKNAALDAKLGNQAIATQARTQAKQAEADQRLGIQAEDAALKMQTQRAQNIQSLNEQAGQAQVNMALQAAEGEQKLAQQRRENAEKPKPTKTE